MSAHSAHYTGYEPIAIVGIGCRVAGAHSPGALWRLLIEGRDQVGEIPSSRWDVDQLYSPDPRAPGRMVTRAGSFLERSEEPDRPGEIDGFDWRVFGIPPREAKHVDPQHRILLEVAWEALEDAGWPLESIAGAAGAVHIGIFTRDYEKQLANRPELIEGYTAASNTGAFAANRLSFFFDLRGPSVAVDATSASSAVAIHQACRSIWAGEAEFALTGGVSLILAPDVHISMSKAGALSPSGRCRTLDADADGMVRGEGAGLLVLAPLSRARARGDRIYATIEATAANHVGRAEWIMAPTQEAQQAVVRAAYAGAGLDPARVDYVELHGTGTTKGDPIEARALGAVVGAARWSGRPCLVGSVKTNFGHLDAAAGALGTLKTALALYHGQIPPSLHFRRPPSGLDLEALGLAVASAATDWPSRPGARHAGVTSVGFGGVNVHLVLSDAHSTAAELSAAERPAQSEGVQTSEKAVWPDILPLSAHSEAALRDLAGAYADFLDDPGQLATAALGDVCYTAGVRRTHHPSRLAVVGSGPEELAAALRKRVRSQSLSAGPRVGLGGAGAGPLVFVFPGHGAQWLGMGCALRDTSAVFREALEACDRALQAHVSWSLMSELDAPAERSQLHRTEVLQPVLFAVEVALAALWRWWGVVPDAVVGHSMGEVAAAHVAGALSLADATAVVYHRSRLAARSADRGGVLVVGLDADAASAYVDKLAGQVEIAGRNSPESTLVAGDTGALRELAATLEAASVLCRPVGISYASHSHHMDAHVDELRAALGPIQPRAGADGIAIYSTVLGARCAGDRLDADYWAQNLRRPVDFWGAISALGRDVTRFLEVGPHPVLSPSILETTRARGLEAMVMTSLRRDRDEHLALTQTLATLYGAGQDIDWARVCGRRGRVVSLPSYRWQRQRLWLDSAAVSGDQASGDQASGDQVFGDRSSGAAPAAALAVSASAGRGAGRGAGRSDRHPLLGQARDLAYPPGHYVWEKIWRLEDMPYFADHCVQRMAVVPAAAFIEMVSVAGEDLRGPSQWLFQQVDFQRALILSAGEDRLVQLSLAPAVANAGDAGWSFRVASRPVAVADVAGDREPPPWSLHVTGTLEQHRAIDASAPPALRKLDLDAIAGRLGESLSSAECYRELRRNGLEIDGSFQGIQALRRGAGETLGEVALAPARAPEADLYRIHPAVLDPCMHIIGVTTPARGQAGFVARRAERIALYRSGGRAFRVHCRVESGSAGSTGAITIADPEGDICCEIDGIEVQYLDEHEIRGNDPIAACGYELGWVALPDAPEAREPSGPSRGAAVAPEVGGAELRPWLLLCDRGGVGAAVAARARAAGETIVEVTAGADFVVVDEYHLTIDPAEPDHYQRLLRHVGGDGRCRGVIHCWGLDTPAFERCDSAALQAALQLGCGAALHLLRALADADADLDASASAPARVWLVTRGAQQVGTTDEPAPAALQAPLWGFGRALRWELPERWGALLDLDPLGSSDDAATAIWAAVRERGRDDQLARRGGRMYGPRLSRLRLRGEAAAPPALSAEGSYLITGGLGGLGLALARWMVERGAHKLVLMSRSPLPPRARWREVICAEGAQAEALRTILDLEASGADVRAVAVDVADRAAMVAFAESHRASGWPPIRGVVHAAGSAPPCPVAEMGARDLHQVVSAKIDGGVHLQQLFGNELDFLLLLSSTAALVGSPRLAHYAAGNAFLDALAYYRRGRGAHALSVNWGPIGEVGMVTRMDRSSPASLRGVSPLPLSSVRTVLDRLLGGQRAQAVVWEVDWPAWRRAYPEFSGHPMLAELAGAPAAQQPEIVSGVAAALARPDLTGAEIHQLIERYVAGVVAEVMDVSASEIDADAALGALGFDSLLAVELRARISADLGVDVPILQMLETASVTQLAARVTAARARAAQPVPAATSSSRGSSPTASVGAAASPTSAPPNRGSCAEEQLTAEQAEKLLAHIDELSPDEVDALLVRLRRSGFIE